MRKIRNALLLVAGTILLLPLVIAGCAQQVADKDDEEQQLWAGLPVVSLINYL